MEQSDIMAARAALDAANQADPTQREGRPAALVHADGIDRWLARLVAEPGPALRIAARGQHLERWAIPRDQFPLDRGGYHRWRRAVHERQGLRAAALIAGLVDTAIVQRVDDLIAKRCLQTAEGQALEDATCLVFLEQEVMDFVADHAEYDADRWLRILRRTVAKMSPAARQWAATLALDPVLRPLVEQALAGA